MELIRLNNNRTMPVQGFGTFQITDEKICEESVRAALNAGYRLIDTAACYGNERAVGRAIAKSNIPRNKLYISSKVWIQDAGYEKTKESFQKTLDNLQTDYLDLYLIHMPYGDYYGSWKAMEELYAEGRNHIFTDMTLYEIGSKYHKTPAQVILRWLKQEGIIAIPKSVHEDRIRENFAINDFQLTDEDMDKIRCMDTGRSDILEIRSLDEVYRLYNIRFEQ